MLETKKEKMCSCFDVLSLLHEPQSHHSLNSHQPKEEAGIIGLIFPDEDTKAKREVIMPRSYKPVGLNLRKSNESRVLSSYLFMWKGGSPHLPKNSPLSTRGGLV